MLLPTLRNVATITITILLFAASTFAQQNTREIFERARMLDESNQNLSEAIKLYGQVVGQSNEQRALAARAQFRIGILYERLGRKAEARRAFQTVVNQYADQTELMQRARAKIPASAAKNGKAQARSIAAISALAGAPQVRQVWAGLGADVEGKVSSDGRYLSFVDWSTGDLAVRDLLTRTNRRLTHKGDWTSQAFADFSTISPDGKQIAYQWCDGKLYDLRVVDTDGSEPRVIYENDEVYPWAHAWTSDKKFVLTTLSGKDHSHQIGLVSTIDRSVRILKSYDRRSPENLSLSPDGRWIAYSLPPNQDEKQRDIFLIATDGSQETALVQHPANDDAPVWSPDGRAILFLSDRGASPGLWLIRVANGKADGNPELVKANIGNIFPLGFTEKGSFFYGIISAGHDVYSVNNDPVNGQLVSQPEQLSKNYVGMNFAPAWSLDGNSLAYVVDKTTGFGFSGRAIVVQSLKTGKERELPRQGFEIWGFSLNWSPDGNSLLVTGVEESPGKPPRGGLFQVDVQTGSAKFLVERVNDTTEGHGGSGWFADGKSIFRLQYVEPKKLSITRTNLLTGEEQDLFKFNEGENDLRFIKLSPDGKQLACWNIRKETKSLLLIPTDGGAPKEIFKDKGDVTQVAGTPSGIAWTRDGRHLLFGKKTGPEKTELWRIAVEGGQPQKIGIVNEGVHDIVMHPDGNRIAFSTRTYKPEVWVMENFLPATKPHATSVSRR